MKTDPGQRAYRLVEELRAEVDFEIDDVIADIVRSLPEEYFVALSHQDQLIHLKALLGISICQLNDWIMLRSDNGRHVAVVARQNYSGMLAKIVGTLPKDQALIGAKIFTSKSHDFIIDLFDFQPEPGAERLPSLNKLEEEDLIAEVVKRTGASQSEIQGFVDAYPRGVPAIDLAAAITDQWQAFESSRRTQQNSLHWKPGTQPRVTIASQTMSARDLFQVMARALSEMQADIDQAFLNEFAAGNAGSHVAVASFLVLGDFPKEASEYERYLHDCLQANAGLSAGDWC